MSKLNALAILFIGIVTLLLSSCGKSYSSGENSIPIDVYLYGPLRLSENEIEKNDSLAILLNLINGRVPQINFHRLDLGDSVFRDTVEMGFFNGLFEDLIDVNDMQEDLNNKVFGSDLKAFLTAPRGNEFKELDSMKTYLNIDSILLNRGASQSAILEKCFVKNSQMNNGRILISFLPSRQLIANGDGIPKPEDSTKDSDGDGFDSTNDCNDNDPKINPGTSEICNDSKDNNCDGKVDEGCSVSSGNTGPKLPFNVGLLCKDYSNSPSWNSIPGANKITLSIEVEDKETDENIELYYSGVFTLNGAANSYSCGALGGVNKTATFRIILTSKDAFGNDINLVNNTIKGVRFACSN